MTVPHYSLPTASGAPFRFFPGNLRFLRKKRGLNQEDISALFKKKPNTVGNWENGKTEPSIPELLVISGYFGVNLEDLLRTELRQKVSGNERQLTLWPEPAEKTFTLPGSHYPGSHPAGQSDPGGGMAVEGDGHPAASPREGGASTTPDMGSGKTSTSANRAMGPEAPHEPVPVAGDALWFMLRELRMVQERLDRLQSAFDQSRPLKPTDKSDH